VTPISDARPEPQGQAATTFIRFVALTLLLAVAMVALLYAYRGVR
jgi:hypothetical protein